MLLRCSHIRRGMTLVELMVVVAIIGLLAVAVLPALSSTAEIRRGREAVRVVTSFIAKSQSRAIGRREWSGFQVVPSGSASFTAVDLVLADVPPVYRGDTVPAVVTVAGSGTTRQASWTGGVLQSGSSIGVRAGDLIRFGDEAHWFELAAAPAASASGSVTFLFRGRDAGHEPGNTPWPPSGVPAIPLSFEILRQPTASGSPISLPAGRAIDLFWSGFGPATASLYGRFDVTSSGTTPTAGATTSVLFDAAGRLRQIVVQNATATTTRRVTATGPVFLLIGRPDRVGQLYSPNAGGNDDTVGANWQYPDSFWIAIDLSTGAVTSAECKPNAVGANDTEKLLDSQEWIRQASLAGGR